MESSRAQRIEQAPWPRRVRDCKQIWPRLHGRTESIQQSRTSFQSEQLVGFADLKYAPKGSNIDTAQRRRVDSGGVERMIRKATAFKPAKTRKREPLRTGHIKPRAAILIVPLCARPRIQQDRGDYQIESGACRGVGTLPICPDNDAIPQVAAVEHEMPPPRVHRYIESRIALANNCGHKIRGWCQPIEIDNPVIQSSVKGQYQHSLGRSSHPGCAQQHACA